MKSSLTGLLLALAILPINVQAHASSYCERILTLKLGAGEYQVHDLVGLSATTEDRFDLKQVFSNPEHEVLLGFSRSHAYLVAGNTRLDGTIFGPVRIDHPRVAGKLDSGATVRLKGLSAGTVETLSRYLNAQKGKASFTCVKALFSALDAGAGISLAYEPRVPFRLRGILERVLQEGLVDSSGAPIAVEIYIRGVSTLDALAQDHAFTDLAQTRKWTTLSGAVVVAAMAGSIVYLVFDRE